MVSLSKTLTFRISRLLCGLGFVICCVTSVAYAAPHPATSTSSLVSPSQGLFMLSHGFSLKTAGTSWILDPNQTPSEEWLYLQSGKSAQFKVQSEAVRTELSLESYAKRWMRDYASYGFEMLGTRSFTTTDSRGLVVDLLHRGTQKQVRQAVFLKNKKAVILTCSDQQKSFQSTLSDCNQMIKSFSWIQQIPQKAF